MPHTKDFKKLRAAVSHEYLGAKVPKQYRKRYGKTYGKKDVKSVAYAIANSKGIKIDLY